MPVLTKIVKPEELNAQVICDIAYTWLVDLGPSRRATVMSIDLAEAVLDGLKERGILA